MPPMPTFREEADGRVAPLLTPIAGASPTGVDASYDADFERVKAEIDKLSSVEGKEPAWGDVEEVAASLLSSKSKDLRVVGWLAVAKVKRQGWRGLAEGLLLYRGLSRDFWDGLYPEARRGRARVNAFSWMADMVVQHLQSSEVRAPDGDAVRTCDEVLGELDQLLADKLGELYQGPGMLRSMLREKVRSIPEPVVETPTPQAEAARPEEPRSDAVAAAVPPSAAYASPPTVSSVEDVDSGVRECGASLVSMAALLRGADPSRAWAYRLRRWGTWIAVEEAPPVEEGRTFIRPPDEDVQRRLQALRDGQKWLELIQAGEEAAADNLFWFDAHRHVAFALERLGPAFFAARDAIGREVVAFVSRLPNVASSLFSDGTPFADAATKSWLEEESRRLGGSAGSAASSAASAEDEEIAKRLAEAQDMVREGKVADGLALALALADRCADDRARFRARLAIGKMALEASKPDVARPMFEHLVAEVERHQLESWEPALCASLYAQLLVATREFARLHGASADLTAREQHLFDKLCRLDPASAIKLSG